jgi:peptide-methionine (S)-S-oxide reductase
MRRAMLIRLAAAIAVMSFVLFGCGARAASAAAGSAVPGSAPRASAPFPDPPNEAKAAPGVETAVLAGGCFWGIEGVFERLSGVSSAVSGYSGGSSESAHYDLVSTGTTGHAESVRITFDPSVISYGTLLKIFFSIAHDPTELGYQGPDVGTQYRSVIFYANDAQKRVANEYIALLGKSGIFPKPIVTEMVPLVAFYPAEDYHQKFMDRNPNYPYIVAWDLPKVAALQREYPGLLSGREPPVTVY